MNVARSSMSPATHALLEMRAELSFAEKVRRVDAFLGQDYFHETGIMYCMWRRTDDELRPYRDEDFAGQLPFVRPGMTAAGQMDNENSTYTSGIFLWSQCLRYQVTREPEAFRLRGAGVSFHRSDFPTDRSDPRSRFPLQALSISRSSATPPAVDWTM